MQKKTMQNFASELLRVVPDLHKNNNFDIIFLTLSPYEFAESGYLLEKMLNIPVVLDIRDPWMFDGWNTYRHYILWYIDFLKMKKHIKGVSGLVTNTPETEKVFKKIFNDKIKTKITHITNGYDNEDFQNIILSNTENKNQFILTHTGFFQSSVLFEQKNGLKAWIKKIIYYSPRKLCYEGRSPYYLFKAVKYLEEIRSEYINRLVICLVGLEDPYTKLLVQNFSLEHRIKFIGYVSHDESVRWLKKSDGLFIPLHGVEKGRSFIVPGKLYEYLASGKPILGALPEGDAKDFGHKRGLFYPAEPCDHISIAMALENMMKEHFTGLNHERTIDYDYVNRFERKNLAGKFSGFFQSIINTRGQKNND